MTLPNFKLPEGVIVPNGKKAGDTFQAMATFELKDNGDATLCQVDGENLDGYDDEKSESPNENAADDTTQPASSFGSMLLGSSGGGAPPPQ